MSKNRFPSGLRDALDFTLVEALLGRRSRRFFMGAEIPDGVFEYKSRHKPVPLTDLEKMLVVSACGGNTSWHHMIFRGARYARLNSTLWRVPSSAEPLRLSFSIMRRFTNGDKD